MVSSTCFEHLSVHPQEDFYTQFYGISFMDPYTYVYLLYYVCIAAPTSDAGMLARSQYPEGPATGHLDTEFFGFSVSTSEC